MPEPETRKHVLIVDDNADNRQLLCYVMNSPHFDINEAPDGQTATALIREKHFDLALLDIELPDGNGLDLAADLRSEHPQTILIILSANDSLENIERARSTGAQAYFIKPFNLRRILEFIKAAETGGLKSNAEMQLIG